MTIKFYNSLTNQKEDFVPISEGEVGMYVCGMTVYDNCHLGHARAMMAFDIVARYLRYQGYKVNFIRNITDIDDKIIERAYENKEKIEDLTARTIASMQEDFLKLGLEPPNKEPRATDHIEGMIKMIVDLIDKGNAYHSETGDVFFSVRTFPEYGKLSNKNIDELNPGSRIEEDESKEDPLDFVLWKSAKSNEPSWESPWGPGRPGWHIECSVMSLENLGEHFDIHGGGLDLKFPHHENELAQSCCYSGNLDQKNSYAKYWMHNGFVTVDSEKMSKSLGNISLVKDYLKLYDGEVLRLALLSAHYRSPLNWSKQVLSQSKNRITKYKKILEEHKNLSIIEDVKGNLIVNQVEEALLDDINISKSLSILDANVKDMHKKDEIEKKNIIQAIQYLGKIIGVFSNGIAATLKKEEKLFNEEEINLLIKKRNEARKNKDFDLADNIRKELIEMGIEIKDQSNETVWKKV